MDRRMFLVTLASSFLAAPLAGETQQAEKMHRIGVVTSTAHSIDAFRQGLRELGYVEGQNVIVEQRSTQGRSDRKVELLINLKTARALGLAIPQSLLLRADQVAE